MPPQWLSADIPFSNPTSLLITPDHYVNRMLHSHGVELSALGVAQETMTEQQSRDAFRILCSHWSAYGHSGAVLLDDQLGGIFGVKVRPSAETADQIYDQIASCLDSPEFKPRALYEKFKIEVLATTDDPCDDLAAHQFLRDDENWQGRVIPTFDPTSTSSLLSRTGTPMLTGWLRYPVSTPVTTTATSPPWRTVANTSRTTVPFPPTTATWTLIDTLEVARQSAFTHLLVRVKSRRWRPPRCVAILFRRWHGWLVTTVW